MLLEAFDLCCYFSKPIEQCFSPYRDGGAALFSLTSMQKWKSVSHVSILSKQSSWEQAESEVYMQGGQKDTCRLKYFLKYLARRKASLWPNPNNHGEFQVVQRHPDTARADRHRYKGTLTQEISVFLWTVHLLL